MAWVSTPMPYRKLREAFCHPLRTVQRAIHEVLRLFSKDLYGYSRLNDAPAQRRAHTTKLSNL